MITSPQQSFGSLLKRHRRAAQLTQEQLAIRAGYTTDYVSMLERGQRVPPRETIEILARALDLDPPDREALEGSTRAPLRIHVFGRLLRRRREDAGLTQEALAERVSLSARTISDFERGVRPRLRIEMVHLLADGLGLESEDRKALLSALSPAANPSSNRGMTNLPAEPNALIGREQEVSGAVRLLRSSDVRVLTLTGIGGVGKTRLGLRVAAMLADDFADGVMFVGLGSLRDAGLVPSALADVLGAARASHSSVEQGLVAHLRDQQLLLVLDNFEHLLDSAPLIAHLVASCSYLKFLVTSRAPLHLAAERILEVPPLPLPGAEEKLWLAAARKSPALALFCQRAEAVVPTFCLTEANAHLVTEICRRLDGLPLALELAAARIKVLAPAALLERLERRLNLLTTGTRDLPERQQTLRRTIDWSYDLLGAAEQRLFRLLSVTGDGCTLAAAEAIAGAPCVDQLGGLVDQSLIFVEHSDGDNARFGMLESVREYALDALREQGEVDEARERHALYYLALAEQAEPELASERQASCLDHLRSEHENLRLAIRWLLNAGEIESTLRLTGAVWRFWQTLGYFDEARGWLEEGLSRSDAVPLPVRVRAHFAAGFITLSQGDTARAAVHADACLVLARDKGSLEHIHQALMLRGMVALQSGEPRVAVASFRESIPMAENMGRPRDVGRSLLNLGLAKSEAGESQEAATLIEQALSRFRSSGDASFEAVAVGSLAYTALLTGDEPRATTLMREYLEQAHAMSAVPDTAAGLEGMAALAVRRREFRRAAYLFGAAERLREQSSSLLVSPHNRAAILSAGEEARFQLGETNWQAARLHGWNAALDDVVGEAIA